MSDSFEKPSLVWNNELDTTPLKIRMSGHNLKIPRNYIALGGVASNGQVGLLLMASYPKFEGISESNFSIFSGLTEGKLKFMLRGTTNITPNVIDIYRADRYYMPYRKKTLEIARIIGEKSSIEGLIRVPREHNGEYFVPGYGFQYVHLKVDAEHFDDGIIIDCQSSDLGRTYQDFEDGNMTNTIPGLQECHVDLLIHGIAFEYHFHFSLLREWQNVHQGVVSLLTSFFED